MPTNPSYLDRLLLRFNSVPQLLQEVMAAGTLKAVVLASKLGIFEQLRSNSLTSEELATRVNSNPRGMRILLDLLASTGYLRRAGGRYSNTPQSSKWLERSSKVSLADMAVVWNEKILKFWDLQLERAVRTGEPSEGIFNWFNTEPDAWELFNSFEMATARWIGPDVVQKVRLPPGSKRLVDMGGGHGLYSIMFCRRYPDLSAVILDQPEPLKTAIYNISNEGLTGRISTKAWDLRTSPIEHGFDCALVFNIIHNFSAETNKSLLTRTYEALSEDGLLVVWDNFRGPGRLVNTAFDFFSLAYLVGTGAQTYPVEEVSTWIRDTGFGKVKSYRTVPGLLTASRSFN